MATTQHRIFWTERERTEWRTALELEELPRPDGNFVTIVEAAMKHMERPRPITPGVIKEAGNVIRELRRARSRAALEAASGRAAEIAPEVAAPAPATVPEVAETPAVAAPVFEPEQSATAAGGHARSPHWTEGLATDISGLLVEVIVRTAESVAVRKAVRSLIKVATDPNFTPEIDNTVVWERPVVGPRLPRVLVAGFVKHGPVRDLIGRFGAKLDLRFWRSDDSLAQLRRDLQSAEHVIFMTGSTSHAAEQTCAASGKPYTRVPSASVSTAERALQQILSERGQS